jgi:4-amino-4-deoxy-L-arabinose transferase-like glycosyltransferase
LPDRDHDSPAGLRRVFAAVALLLVLAPLVANAPLFDPDEGLHAAIAQEMVARGDLVTPTFLGEPFLDKPILFFWAEAASLRVFGDRELAIRIPPLLFGLLGMLSVAWLGRALLGERAGLTAGIIYGTMILPLGVSQVAVHDVGLIPFMCGACWCLFSVTLATGARRAAALGLAAGVLLGFSILTKGLVGCVFATIFAGCLAVRQRTATRDLFISLAVAGIVSILVAAPWYWAMERAHPGYLHYYFVERHLQGYLTATQRHAGRPWWYYVPIVLGGALPWTGYLFAAAGAARRDALRLAVWAWFAIGLVFLSVGESKLVTYALPLFPAVALIAETGTVPAFSRSGTVPILAIGIQALVMVALPSAGLAALEWKYGAHYPGLWLPLAVAAVFTAYALWRAWRTRPSERTITWLATASMASLVGMMIVMPRAADWMTSRDLAAALNARETLPPRVSVVDERIGSLVFYLSPPLRVEATSERLAEATFAEAVMRTRVDPDDAIVAVRRSQLERFNRLFPRPPQPDAQAGTFTIFRTITLKETLQQR